MTTFGWVLIGIAFLMLIMVANNSWSFVWTKILAGMGSTVTPAPPISQQARTGGQDTQSGNIQTPPTVQVNTVNGVVQSTSTPNQATA